MQRLGRYCTSGLAGARNMHQQSSPPALAASAPSTSVSSNGILPSATAASTLPLVTPCCCRARAWVKGSVCCSKSSPLCWSLCRVRALGGQLWQGFSMVRLGVAVHSEVGVGLVVQRQRCRLLLSVFHQVTNLIVEAQLSKKLCPKGDVQYMGCSPNHQTPSMCTATCEHSHTVSCLESREGWLFDADGPTIEMQCKEPDRETHVTLT